MKRPAGGRRGAGVGRFIVEIGGERRTRLAAHEVVELLEGAGGGAARVYRIHRVDDEGRMELVGVSAEQFSRPDCLILSRDRPAGARAAFEAVRSAAIETAPPCRIEVQLSTVPSFEPSHVVVLVFPAACGEGIGHWLRQVEVRAGGLVDGGATALRTYLDADPQVIEQAVLEAGRAS